MESYFAMIRGVEMGPYTMQDLSSMLMRGEVNSETMVRKPDGAWFKLSSIPALFSTKEWLVALLLSLFLGYFGVDRFYLGHIGLGIVKLLTGGGCGIWWLVDFILIAVGQIKDSNGLPLRR